MLAELFLFLFIGVLFGTITGLTPGIHINLVGALLISSFAKILFPIKPIYLLVFITSMAITHTFLDFIPSIFLGCPDTDTELSILPGHQFLKQGLGHEAILLTLYGSLSATLLLPIITYPTIKIIGFFYEPLNQIIPYLLLAVSIFLIFSDNKKQALVIFLLTGTLGTINSTMTFNQPLLPLLSGLFGASSIVQSINNKTKIPKQKITKPKFNFKPILASIFSAPLCSFLPGLGSGQAAVIGSSLIKNDQKNFLILLGATNTLVMEISFLTLYLTSKTRTGAAMAIKEILPEISSNYLILLISIVLLSGIISFYLTRFISIKFVKKIEKINYKKTSISILILLTIIVTIVSGLIGLIILIISTFTGLYCINLKARRTNMMGCLIIPTILFYLI